MNCEQILQKIHELNPFCQITFLNALPEDVKRLFLIFIARCQYSGAVMHNRYEIKSCNYMKKDFYRLSVVFPSGAGPKDMRLPKLNVDCETLDMYHANGKVARANLLNQNYKCIGYSWVENTKNIAPERIELFDQFVRLHNLM